MSENINTTLASLKEMKAQLPARKRIMGIDHSRNMLGLALADPDLTIATPLKSIKRIKFTLDVVTLAKVAKDYDVAGFIIGLPLNMDGTSGPRVDSVRHFGDNLINAADVFGFTPLIGFWDERLTTHEATRFLIDEIDLSRKKRAKSIDRLAASHILQGALDAMRHL